MAIRGETIIEDRSTQDQMMVGSFDKSRVLELKAYILKELNRKIKHENEIIQYTEQVMADNQLMQQTATALGKKFAVIQPPQGYYEAIERRNNRSADCFDREPLKKMEEEIHNKCRPVDTERFCHARFLEVKEARAATEQKWNELKGNGAVTAVKNLHNKLVEDINKSITKFSDCEKKLDEYLYNEKCYASYENIYNDDFVDLITSACTRESIHHNIDEFIGWAEGISDQPVLAKQNLYKTRFDAMALGETLYQINDWLKKVNEDLFKKDQQDLPKEDGPGEHLGS